MRRPWPYQDRPIETERNDHASHGPDDRLVPPLKHVITSREAYRTFTFLPPRPAHAFRDKACERLDVAVDARTVELRKIRVAVLDAHDRPEIAAGSKHRIHQEPRHASVAVGIRMDIAEEPVAENRHTPGSHSCASRSKNSGWRAYGLPARRHLARRAQVDGVIAVASERARRKNTRRHAGLEQFSVPVAVRVTDKLSRIDSADDLADIRLHDLESLRVAASRERVAEYLAEN